MALMVFSSTKPSGDVFNNKITDLITLSSSNHFMSFTNINVFTSALFFSLSGFPTKILRISYSPRLLSVTILFLFKINKSVNSNAYGSLKVTTCWMSIIYEGTISTSI